ncbi:MAG TPA: hypothetical protein VMP10_01630 [Chloroflexota bacterium]|nr:hypothetical protein [Chloroflexota bacterium]
MSNREEHFIREIVASSVGNCGDCGVTFGATDVSIVGHQDTLWFLSLSCPGCHNHSLIAAVIQESNATETPGEVVDAPAREASTPISSDDVTDMHEFLADFDGDFGKLLGRAS